MQNSSAIKISSLPIGFYNCVATHEISSIYGLSHILNLQNTSGEKIDVFANNNLNKYISQNPGQQFSFRCEGQKTFLSGGEKSVTFVKISELKAA